MAFCARSYSGLRYDQPALFVIHSLDGRPLASSHQVRIDHGFGDRRVRFPGKVVEAATEEVMSQVERNR
jgi:hypothetical protein